MARLRLLASRRPESAPLFLNLNYMGAHEPYLPPPPYRDMFPGSSSTFRTERGLEIRKALADHRRTPEIETDLKHVISQYDAGIAFMDAEVKRVLDGLKAAGLYDNSLIIVTADHGEALGERNDFGHPASVHQELVHVPLLIKYPRTVAAQSPRQVDALVSGLDLMPTILDVAGIPIPSNLQGLSLRALAQGPDRIVMTESFVDAHLTRIHRRSDNGQFAVYQGPWKLIATTPGSKELYHWTTDPGEAHNLYDPANPAARTLSDYLDRWLQAVPRLKMTTKKMDPRTTNRLRGLGYIR